MKGKLLIVVSLAMFVLVTVVLPNISGSPTNGMGYFVLFGIPLIVLSLGAILMQLERIEILLKAKETQKPVYDYFADTLD